MRKSIGLKGEEADKLDAEYFEKLLKDPKYGIKGNFTVAYEPGKERGTGTVTITGESFDTPAIYTVLSRNFTLTDIKNGKGLEDRLGGTQ